MFHANAVIEIRQDKLNIDLTYIDVDCCEKFKKASFIAALYKKRSPGASFPLPAADYAGCRPIRRFLPVS